MHHADNEDSGQAARIRCAHMSDGTFSHVVYFHNNRKPTPVGNSGCAGAGPGVFNEWFKNSYAMLKLLNYRTHPVFGQSGLSEQCRHR